MAQGNIILRLKISTKQSSFDISAYQIISPVGFYLKFDSN